MVHLPEPLLCLSICYDIQAQIPVVLYTKSHDSDKMVPVHWLIWAFVICTCWNENIFSCTLDKEILGFTLG